MWTALLIHDGHRGKKISEKRQIWSINKSPGPKTPVITGSNILQSGWSLSPQCSAVPVYNKVYIFTAYCPIYKYTYKDKKILRNSLILIPTPLLVLIFLLFLFSGLIWVTSFSSIEISLGRVVLALFQRRGRYFSQKCHQWLFRLSSQDGEERRLLEKLRSGSIVEVVILYFSNL